MEKRRRVEAGKIRWSGKARLEKREGVRGKTREEGIVVVLEKRREGESWRDWWSEEVREEGRGNNGGLGSGVSWSGWAWLGKDGEALRIY